MSFAIWLMPWTGSTVPILGPGLRWPSTAALRE
jgi:hypothetical protein